MFVRPDQIEQKVEQIRTMIKYVLETFDLKYEIEESDGAFYGPKIDFAFEDAIDRSWDGPTVQLDFNRPERFNLSHVGEDNEKHRPVMIHRALYGSYERFSMMLIEHYEGRFPLWLAPEQVRMLPIFNENLEYAQKVASEFDDFRVEVDDRDSTLERKIRAAHDDRVPYQIIIGDNEKEAGTISVRDASKSKSTISKLTHSSSTSRPKSRSSEFNPTSCRTEGLSRQFRLRVLYCSC